MLLRSAGLGGCLYVEVTRNGYFPVIKNNIYSVLYHQMEKGALNSIFCIAYASFISFVIIAVGFLKWKVVNLKKKYYGNACLTIWQTLLMQRELFFLNTIYNFFACISYLFILVWDTNRLKARNSNHKSKGQVHSMLKSNLIQIRYSTTPILLD